MKAGDNILVTGGERQGKTGGVIGIYQAQGLVRLRDVDFRGLWYIELEDGTQEVIHESLMEVI